MYRKGTVDMEAAALSAAITGMLKIVGNKLASLVIKEYSSIVGVKKDLQELQHLAQEINCWLEIAGERTIGDALWLKRLKEVAYDMDDAVDEFQLNAEKHDVDGYDGFVSRYLLKKTESFIFECKAAKKIKKIKNRFAEIVKQRTDLTAIFGRDPISHIDKKVVNMQTLPVGDEVVLVGRDQEMQQIISNLVGTNDKNKIKIVSIVGLGGSGKTTLAKLVYNDGKIIEKHFEVRLWVHVSQEFDFEKLIKKLFEAFADKDSLHPSLPYMSKRIQDGLNRKKFLIVLDDVWTESQNQWDKIMGYLKNGAPGSGILLTTRSENVAEAVQSTYQFCLPRLSPDDSWQLFQQSFRMPAKILESDFFKVGKEIVETCCGLPLAIKVLAGSLGDKELIGEWHAMRHNLLDVEGEESVSACLKLSYFHLPSHLKQCFTICSLFPKGHVIYKQQLIDQWIAHDMISLTPGVDDLVHIGHRYFSSLVHVSFLQDVEEYEGAVICKMHDLVHDLARSILSEEVSTIITPEYGTSSTKGYRYYSLVKQPRSLLPEKIFENARAIYVDGGDNIIFDKALKNSKHLRSIIIVNYVFSTTVPTAIIQVKNLKYLKISLPGCESLPEAISDIWSLQALYLTSTEELLELPKSIGKLIKLRTLSLSCCPKLMSLPSGITTLKNLEYLKLGWCSQWLEFPDGIGNLTKLKALDLYIYKAMPPGIGQLTRLEKLNSFCVSFDKKYAQISELASLSRISGKLSICFLRRLTNPCDARQACLKQKENLHELELSWGSLHSRVNAEHEVAVLDGLEPPLGIKRLKINMFGGEEIACWMLKQAGCRVQGLRPFPFLTEISLHDFPNLKHLDGLVQMPCLEKLNLKNMPVLESISGGPFPSLVELKMKGLHSLGVVWMVTDRTLIGKEGEGCSNHSPHQLGQLQIGSCLTNLDIEDCHKLRVKPYFPFSLKQLKLDHINSNLLIFSSFSLPPSLELRSGCVWELLQHISALESLEIFRCNDLTELPECLGELCSLQKMTIISCNSLSSLPQSIGFLISLRELLPI
jgi:hypothetical protein